MRSVVTSDHQLFPLANFLKSKEVVNALLWGVLFILLKPGGSISLWGFKVMEISFLGLMKKNVCSFPPSQVL